MFYQKIQLLTYKIIPESCYTKKETVDFITARNSDRKVMQPIGIMS